MIGRLPKRKLPEEDDLIEMDQMGDIVEEEEELEVPLQQTWKKPRTAMTLSSSATPPSVASPSTSPPSTSPPSTSLSVTPPSTSPSFTPPSYTPLTPAILPPATPTPDNSARNLYQLLDCGRFYLIFVPCPSGWTASCHAEGKKLIVVSLAIPPFPLYNLVPLLTMGQEYDPLVRAVDEEVQRRIDVARLCDPAQKAPLGTKVWIPLAEKIVTAREYIVRVQGRDNGWAVFQIAKSN